MSQRFFDERFLLLPQIMGQSRFHIQVRRMALSDLHDDITPAQNQ
jgi:hypothetical protein